MFAIRRVRRFLADQRGGVSVMLVLMLIPMIGVMGMAVEGASFYFTGRAMQNAADSAALAAATNTCDAAAACHTASPFQPSFVQEAAAVATNYGFTDGVNDTTVSTKTKACPADPSATCYWVKITRAVPVNMLRIIGFRGDAALSNGLGRGQTIAALSVASPKANPSTFCILSLAAGGPGTDGILTHGSPKADLTGCSVASNGDATCTGNGLKADATYAAGSASGCSASGGNDHSNQPPVADKYAALASKIPSDSCGNTKSAFTPPASTNTLSGAITLGSTKIYCGNVTLSADANVTTPAAGTVMVIVDGSLNIPGGMTFKTTATSSDDASRPSGITIVFTGRSVSGLPKPTATLIGGGTIDIAAPRSGDWSGIAIYTNPALTDSIANVDYSAAGNSPTWNITGLIYVPNADILFSGIINKASNGLDCFAIVDNTFQSNGTTKLLEFQTQCAQAGLIPPSGGTAIRQALVQ